MTLVDRRLGKWALYLTIFTIISAAVHGRGGGPYYLLGQLIGGIILWGAILVAGRALWRTVRQWVATGSGDD